MHIYKYNYIQISCATCSHILFITTNLPHEFTLTTFFFKIKHMFSSGSFPMNCPSCSPTTQRFLQRPPRSVPPRSLRSLRFVWVPGILLRGVGDLLVYNMLEVWETQNSKSPKSWIWSLRLLGEDFLRLLDHVRCFWKCLKMFWWWLKMLEHGWWCLIMLDDAWCVWSCLEFWWILRFCRGGLWCDENVWRRCVQLFRDGWSCFKTFKMPKRRLKMAENVKSCLRIIQDGLWCFQRYLNMLLKVAWKMVKDY